MSTVDHRVEVTIDNGFAHTEVHQTFFNPADQDLEAIFPAPAPQERQPPEMTIYAGDRELHGEVLAADQARSLYEDEKQRGNDTGLASKNDIQSFDFRVYPVRAGAQTTISFVYYQPLSLDTGIGRYVYPLQEGGTDEAAEKFWTLNQAVDGTLSIDVDLQSAWPIADVRVPGFEAAAQVTETGSDRYRIHLERPQAALDTDFVVYYRLEQGLPGRVELLTQRPDPSQPGTFMMVLTPALDLGPITGGRDFVFVLDTSGSMADKIGTLARGVSRALGELNGEDRFRIVTFDSQARELGRGRVQATPENVEAAVRGLEGLRSGGSTDLYAGLEMGLAHLDDDRATSIILVTDGVTNTGLVDPKAFYELTKKNDVRIFGFLLGNSANWPLMELITDTSGGFYSQVSNQDDILGQILLAKEKVTHEALTGAQLHLDGVDAFDVTGRAPRKIYRGQQLVLFGRYKGNGKATVRLDANLTGQDVSYTTHFDFLAQSDEHPELERLWALARIEEIEGLMRAGLLDPSEGKSAARTGRRLPDRHRRDRHGGDGRRRLHRARRRAPQPGADRDRARRPGPAIRSADQALPRGTSTTRCSRAHRAVRGQRRRRRGLRRARGAAALGGGRWSRRSGTALLVSDARRAPERAPVSVSASGPAEARPRGGRASPARSCPSPPSPWR